MKGEQCILSKHRNNTFLKSIHFLGTHTRHTQPNHTQFLVNIRIGTEKRAKQ